MRKGDIKTIAGNFFAYPFQLVYVLLIVLIAQCCGLMRLLFQTLFSKNKSP